MDNLLASDSVNVAGNIDNQTVKEDIYFTNADFEGSLTVNTNLLNEEGRAEIGDAYKNLDENLETVATHLKDSAGNVVESVAGAFNGENHGVSAVETLKNKQLKQTTQIARSRDNRARDTIENSDLGQMPENLQYALNVGDQKDNLLYSNTEDNALGFYDQVNGQGYVNIGQNAISGDTLIYTDTHEATHATTNNDAYANAIGSEAVDDWSRYSSINSGYRQSGYDASYYGIVTTGTPVSQTNYNTTYNPYTSVMLRNNTQAAHSVQQENKDELIPLIIALGALAYTTLTGEGNPADGLEIIGNGEDLINTSVSSGVEKTIEASMEHFPDATETTLKILAKAGEITDETLVYWDDATGNRVSSEWGKLPERLRSQIKGAVAVGSVVIPAGAAGGVTKLSKLDAPDINTPDLGNDGPYDSRTIYDELVAKYEAENVTSTTVPPSNAPNVKLAGQAHPKTGVVFDNKGFPIFDQYSAYDTRIPADQFNSMSYTQQMQAASRDLANAIDNGQIPASKFTPKQLQQINSGAKKIDDFTWHHHQDAGRMQLVPEDYHNKTGHMGGNSMQEGR